jgi:hypothetical protein
MLNQIMLAIDEVSGLETDKGWDGASTIDYWKSELKKAKDHEEEEDIERHLEILADRLEKDIDFLKLSNNVNADIKNGKFDSLEKMVKIKFKIESSLDGREIWEYIQRQVANEGIDGFAEIESKIFSNGKSYLIFYSVEVEHNYNEETEEWETDIELLNIQ